MGRRRGWWRGWRRWGAAAAEPVTCATAITMNSASTPWRALRRIENTSFPNQPRPTRRPPSPRPPSAPRSSDRGPSCTPRGTTSAVERTRRRRRAVGPGGDAHLCILELEDRRVDPVRQVLLRLHRQRRRRQVGTTVGALSLGLRPLWPSTTKKRRTSWPFSRAARDDATLSLTRARRRGGDHAVTGTASRPRPGGRGRRRSAR